MRYAMERAFMLIFAAAARGTVLALPQTPCPAGTYATTDGLSCAECPEGFYGDTEGLTTRQCSGECLDGYWCPPGSTSPTARACADGVDESEAAQYYCEAGKRRLVSPGFYTIPENKCDQGLNIARLAGVVAKGSTELAGHTADSTIDGDKSGSPAVLFRAQKGVPQLLTLDFRGVNPLLFPAYNERAERSAPRVCSYEVTAGSNLASNPLACGWDAPMDWQLEGSNAMLSESLAVADAGASWGGGALSGGPRDGFGHHAPGEHVGSAAWTVVHAVRGEVGWTCGETRRFVVPLQTQGNYALYRLRILATPGRPLSVGGGVFVAVKEFGLFLSDGADARHRTGQLPCPAGHYCEGPGTKTTSSGAAGAAADRAGGTARRPIAPAPGVRLRCPEGTFGSGFGLQESRCSGVCDAGSYCPQGSTSPTACEPGFYCPDGRARIPCPAGRYGSTSALVSRNCSGPCEKGHWCEAGSADPKQHRCAAGRFGAEEGMTSPECSGPCAEGYFCGDAQANVTRTPGDAECAVAGEFCPLGSAAPTSATAGHYTVGGTDSGRRRRAETLCPPGSYCVGGERFPCPPGTYSEGEGTAARCTALCPLGHFCPEGSPAPTLCAAGRYGASEGQHLDGCSGVCAPGFYCPAGSTSPTEKPCPDGTVAADRVDASGGGLGSLDDCSATCASGYCPGEPCPAGHYCPAETAPGHAKNHAHPCGSPTLFCPAASSAPTPVSAGFYSTGGTAITRSGQASCDPGWWCDKGSRHPCPPGKWGGTAGLATPECSGDCEKGHYCEAGSTRSTGTAKCPPGRFGDSAGLRDASCGGACSEGSYCPAGSTSATESPCGGAEVFCPAGSAAPRRARAGFYTVGADGQATTPEPGDPDTGGSAVAMAGNVLLRVREVECEKGHWCAAGVKKPCPAGRYGGRTGLSSAGCSGACSKGFFCVEGSTSSKESPCPAGRFGNTTGLGTADCSGRCEAGAMCKSGSISPNGMIVARN
jgi:hypothetical protein